MRRLSAIAVLTVLSLAVFPVRADAYFWAWLDDLSGPKFAGIVFEWRVYSRSESIAAQQRALLEKRGEYAALLETYKEGAKTGPGKPFYENAVKYMEAALVFLDFAIEALDKDPNADVSRLLVEAFRWSMHAAAHADWAGRLNRSENVDTKQPPGTPEPPDLNKRALATFVIPVGVTFSLCQAKAGRRDTQYLNVIVGYAWDMKGENEAFKHRMFNVGASYHLVAAPYLTLGAGGGVATFTSRTGEPFHKLYVQPIIVDVRPFLFAKKHREASPWWHVIYLRGTLLTFPTGFEAGRFGNQTERYHAELIPTAGLHFDLAPVLQELQGKWRRRQRP